MGWDLRLEEYPSQTARSAPHGSPMRPFEPPNSRVVRVRMSYAGQPGSPSLMNRIHAPCMSSASACGAFSPTSFVAIGSARLSHTKARSTAWAALICPSNAADSQEKRYTEVRAPLATSFGRDGCPGCGTCGRSPGRDQQVTRACIRTGPAVGVEHGRSSVAEDEIEHLRRPGLVESEHVSCIDVPRNNMSSSRQVPTSTSTSLDSPAAMASMGRCGRTSPPCIGCQPRPRRRGLAVLHRIRARGRCRH